MPEQLAVRQAARGELRAADALRHRGRNRRLDAVVGAPDVERAVPAGRVPAAHVRCGAFTDAAPSRRDAPGARVLNVMACTTTPMM
jgi:hypothetical protein